MRLAYTKAIYIYNKSSSIQFHMSFPAMGYFPLNSRPGNVNFVLFWDLRIWDDRLYSSAVDISLCLAEFKFTAKHPQAAQKTQRATKF